MNHTCLRHRRSSRCRPDALARRSPACVSAESVHAALHNACARLESATTIHTHLPLSTIRRTTEHLSTIRETKATPMTIKPEVLFVCVHNAGRSQMAAALLDHLAAGRVTVRSAGSAPAASINPAVVEALAEIGLDVSREFPKKLSDEAVRASDVVITMGCGDACPVYPGKRYLNWELDDPAGQGIDAVRIIRDDIHARVRQLLAELGTSNA